MEVSQTALAWLLVCCAICGAGFGVAYDVLRLFRPWSSSAMSESAQRLAERLSLPPWLSWRSSSSKRPSLPPMLSQGLLYGVLMLYDVLYCLACATALALILYAIGDGQMRLSALAVFGIGWGVYAATVGVVVRRLSCYLYVLLRSILAWAVSLVVAPVRLLIRFLWHRSASLRRRASAVLVQYHTRMKAALCKRKERRRAKKTLIEQENEIFVPIKPNDKHYFSTRRKENA
ncbi:MAG: spore cortex biosynthesis protein YabQ [Clostridia bacterium]|nr:spore cortex biosynthesis protein YabQ [Clostridia bacterium]